MRVAVVAGPDPGHAFPALALVLRLLSAGHRPVLHTGARWLEHARAAGVEMVELRGLEPRPADDDGDIGQRIHARAAFMATLLADDIAPGTDLVVGDVITACAGMAAELSGIAWVELTPHPLYLPSRSLPPIGSGMAPGVGVRGSARDVVLRRLTARSIRLGREHRRSARKQIGLPALDPGPAVTMVATVPALEPPRADWPMNARLVGPLLWEPPSVEIEPPPGDGPVVVVAPSTAHTGAIGMLEATVAALDGTGVRLVASMLDQPPDGLPSWVRAGRVRQDLLLRHADVVVCGAGHGMLVKTLCAGVPVVAVPGQGDQWELANRAARQGSAVVVRPVSVDGIGKAVQQVLSDPSFTAAAVTAAQTAQGVVDPVDLLTSVLACGSRPRPRRPLRWNRAPDRLQ